MRIANLKKAVWGLMAFASTLVCVMDCYPLIPAVYGVYCLSSGHTIIFYIGLIIGMGYFISIPSICKYLFIIAVIYFGERLFVRKSSKNGCLTTAVVAACATAVMNLSVTFLGRPDTDEIVLSVAESLVVFSMAFVLCRACEYLRALEHNENPVIAGLLPDREEAFATAVSGLSGIISTANVMAVKCTADKIPDESEKIQLEVTGRLCACCEGCSVCWTSGTSISDSIKMLADAVRKRMKTEEIVQNRYVDGCPHYTRMVEAATEAFARIELNEAWYRRLTENRRVIATQLDAMAELMDSWCRAEKCIDKKRRLRLSRVYVYTKEAGIQVENAHIYENARQQVCIKADVCTKIDGGIEISKYVQAVSRAMGVKLRQAHGTVSIISDERTSIVLYEENQFYALSGVAYAGVAGGADIILLPEIPYDIDKVVDAIHKRTKEGKGFTILAVAEGAISKEDAALSKKEYRKKLAKSKYPSVSYEVADRISERLGLEVRVAVPGHTQRGGSPCPYDRVLCTRLGSAAAKAIMDEDYGCMIAMVNGQTKKVPLADVAGKLKTVDPKSQMIKEAKRTGICFGD